MTSQVVSATDELPNLSQATPSLFRTMETLDVAAVTLTKEVAGDAAAAAAAEPSCRK